MAMTLEAALAGTAAPARIKRELALVEVEHWGFDQQFHCGHIVVHQDLAPEVRDVFAEIAAACFPIEKIVPLSHYAWSDDASMADNNSSGFNFRRAVGKRALSQHAHGRAIDINPRLNPYLKGGLILPPGALYDPNVPGTLLEDGPVVRAFEERGWTWGGRWTRLKDWHHFEKRRLSIAPA